MARYLPRIDVCFKGVSGLCPVFPLVRWYLGKGRFPSFVFRGDMGVEPGSRRSVGEAGEEDADAGAGGRSGEAASRAEMSAASLRSRSTRRS